nr:hypothetical protein [Pandoravirus belohorizontensis]
MADRRPGAAVAAAAAQRTFFYCKEKMQRKKKEKCKPCAYWCGGGDRPRDANQKGRKEERDLWWSKQKKASNTRCSVARPVAPFFVFGAHRKAYTRPVRIGRYMWPIGKKKRFVF